MNDARQRLWESLMGGDRDRTGHKEFAAALDVYDHELAEQIRVAAGDVNYGDAAAASRAAFAEEFADLIDPEAQR